MPKWDYLIEGDQEIRSAERSGDVETILKAYKRAGQEGGGTSAFGRAEIGGWNRRSAKGFTTPYSASTFIKAALARNYAVVILSTQARLDRELQNIEDYRPRILYVTRDKDEISVWNVTRPGEQGKLWKIHERLELVIQHIYNDLADNPDDITPRFAVIPRSSLPKALRTGEGIVPSPGDRRRAAGTLPPRI